MNRILNADPFGKIALQGYDPVAFHVQGKAVKGDPYIAAEALGYKFLFASEEDKAAFLKDPQKYLPAYGGYCAFGVTLGVFFPVEIGTWEMYEGRLVLQYNEAIKAKFAEDKTANHRKAAAKWREMEAELAK
jgi:YHS domain-containing protein